MNSPSSSHESLVEDEINVLGEVYNRAALVYNPNNTVADYLNQVGGLRADALEKEIYLVQLDGTVISNSQSQFAIVSAQGQTVRFRDFFAVQPQPGDSIIVPRRSEGAGDSTQYP